MKIEIHSIGELKSFFRKLPKESSCNFLQFLAKKIYRYAKKYASDHKRTGKMEHNIDYIVYCNKQGKSTAIIEVSDDGMLVEWKGRKINYAWFVHEGTQSHFIHPKFRKALRWAKYGKTYSPDTKEQKSIFAFAKAVRHPGHKGDPFMTRALKKASGEAMRYFGRFVDGL